MRAVELVRESLASAWAQRTPSTVVAVIVAALCVTVLSTVGRTAATEQQVRERVEAAGSRVLVVTDASGQDLLPRSVVAQVEQLNTVERAVALGAPVDMTNGVIGSGGVKVPVWSVTGHVEDVVQLTAGRWPGPGEALVSAAAAGRLGMDHPFGVLGAGLDEVAVVGSYVPRTPFEDYGSGAVVPAAPDAVSRTLHVVVTDSAAALATEHQVVGIVAPPQPDAIDVRSPATLAGLQAEVGADLTAAGQALLYGTLGAGAVLTAAVVLADVLVRRRDLGRRRALGATRSTVVALVVLRTVWPAAVGSALGTGAGLAWSHHQGVVPPASFAGGVAVLGLLAAGVAAVPPALVAAAHDPVRVLRTP